MLQGCADVVLDCVGVLHPIVLLGFVSCKARQGKVVLGDSRSVLKGSLDIVFDVFDCVSVLYPIVLLYAV